MKVLMIFSIMFINKWTQLLFLVWWIFGFEPKKIRFVASEFLFYIEKKRKEKLEGGFSVVFINRQNYSLIIGLVKKYINFNEKYNISLTFRLLIFLI